MKVYIQKADTFNFQTIPVPDDLENYYVVDMTQEQIDNIKVTETYDHDVGAFVYNLERARIVAYAEREEAYRSEVEPLKLRYEIEGDKKLKELISEKINEIVERIPIPQD